MKGPAKYAAWLLPLLLLTGCFHKKKPAPQAQIRTLAPPLVGPPPPPVPAPAAEPAGPPLTATTVTAEAAATAAAAAPPKPEPKPPVRHRKPVTKSPEVAASDDTPAVSAIGQLTSGDPADLRAQTQNSIDSTERGLKSVMSHKLNVQDQRTIEHIQAFLKQAKKALDLGDLDGASTLAAKAKVLLAEVVR
jgi:hypothetical protein